jgi:hypothetical protein
VGNLRQQHLGDLLFLKAMMIRIISHGGATAALAACLAACTAGLGGFPTGGEEGREPSSEDRDPAGETRESTRPGRESTPEPPIIRPPVDSGPFDSGVQCGAPMLQGVSTTCQSCVARSCCSQATSCLDQSDCQSLVACYRTCTDANCPTTCEQQHVSTASIGRSLVTCIANFCNEASCQ